MAVPGVLFLLGRHAYWKGYVKEPSKRMLGNVITVIASVYA